MTVSSFGISIGIDVDFVQELTTTKFLVGLKKGQKLQTGYEEIPKFWKILVLV